MNYHLSCLIAPLLISHSDWPSALLLVWGLIQNRVSIVSVYVCVCVFKRVLRNASSAGVEAEVPHPPLKQVMWVCKLCGFTSFNSFLYTFTLLLILLCFSTNTAWHLKLAYFKGQTKTKKKNLLWLKWVSIDCCCYYYYL